MIVRERIKRADGKIEEVDLEYPDPPPAESPVDLAEEVATLKAAQQVMAEELEDARAENESLRLAIVDELVDLQQRDFRQDVTALLAAAVEKGLLTTEEVDAQRKSTYRDNGDGTISLLGKDGSSVKTFRAAKGDTDFAVYELWLGRGGIPLEVDAKALGR